MTEKKKAAWCFEGILNCSKTGLHREGVWFETKEIYEIERLWWEDVVEYSIRGK